MKPYTSFNLLLALGLILILCAGSSLTQDTTVAAGTPASTPPDMAASTPLSTSFTYQGRLTDGGAAANGDYDFEFKLYEDPSGTGQVGSTVAVGEKTVSNGLFTVQLDFGAVFAGDARYLEIGVRPGSSSGAYTTLSPRQEITAAPYALYALNVATHDHWGETWTGAGTGLNLSGGTTGLSASGGTGVSGSSSSGFGVVGSSASGYGVYGSSTSGYGVYGSSFGANASVYGNNTSSGPGVRGASSSGYGVSGSTSSSTNAGVYGSNTSSGPGVRGESSSGYGVSGASSSTSAGIYGSNTGSGIGVYGNSASGWGVYGASGSSTGVQGQSTSDHGVAGRTSSGAGYAGVSGWNYGAGDGVSGWSVGGIGVYGTTSNAKPAIWGNHTAGEPGVFGLSVNGPGVSGQTGSSSKAGVVGANTSTGPGVKGESTSGNAIHGEASTGHGVFGRSTGGNGVAGVSATGYGVSGESTSGTGARGWSSSGAGVEGISTSGYGVYGTSSTSYAGYFIGNVHVTDALSKGAGAFKIDHPLDPENKYLYHSFVESPDMINVYNGNVVLDKNGEAWVTMPAWFEALNKDYRYQLTPIGAPGPNLYVAAEITNNRFKIAGGAAGLKVSWQVTGIRHDPYAEANRIPVEEAKPAGERGAYLHPQAYGQPETKGVDYRMRSGGGK